MFLYYILYCDKRLSEACMVSNTGFVQDIAYRTTIDVNKRSGQIIKFTPHVRIPLRSYHLI